MVLTCELSEACYSFDTVAVFRDRRDGALWWGQDAGCSCPMPFDCVELMPLRSVDDVSAIESFRPESGQMLEFGDFLASVRKLVAAS